jgi:hypothetical protein
MNVQISNLLITIAALAGLWACSSTPQNVENDFVSGPPPPPDLEFDLPLEGTVPSTPEPPARICQLGTTCLTMDPRPFESCLLTTKHCKDKAAEPILVGPPVWIAPAPQDASR